MTDGNLTVVLTGRRRSHYLGRHPEVSGLEEWLIEALLDPDEVHRNKTDQEMAIFFYRQMAPTSFMRVAVLMQPSPARLKHSVLSARKAKLDEVLEGQPRLVWKRV